MSTTRIRNLSLALGLLAALALTLTVRGLTADTGGSRELVLYARDMAFYLPGDPIPNPTLRVHAGEEVEVVLVNDEPGMRHDLAVEDLGFAIAEVGLTPGSRGTATLRVPQQPGHYPYVCTLHAQMMRGVLEVLPARS
jgi:plastocyanin